jgi:two-component system response regulator DevR
LHILSPQERRVIALIAEGGTNKEIATKLVLSEKTVKNYIVNIFAKLKIERRAQAAAIYMRVQQHQNPVREEISV